MLINSAIADLRHPPFVDFVGARPREWHYPQRQLSSFGLSFQYRPPRAVHSHTLEFGVESGQQADQFNVGLLA
jgi:hypothetical protein